MNSVMWNGYGMGGFGGLSMLIFGVLAILGIVLLIRWLSDDSRRNSSPILEREMAKPTRQRDEALEIARARLAKGEIMPEEFESIKRGLEG